MRLQIDSTTTVYPLVNSTDASDQYDFETNLKDGIAAAQAGERETARTLLAMAADSNPQSEDAWMWLASISEYPEELLAFLNNVLQINPDNQRAVEWQSATRVLLAKTLVQRGIEAHNLGSSEQAAAYFHQALANDENCEMGWFWLAGTAADDESKRKCLNRVLEINPENQEAKDVIDVLDRAQAADLLEAAKKAAVNGEHEEAVSMIDTVLENDPVNVQAWMLRSHFTVGLEDKLASLGKVLEIEPDNIAARSSYDILASTVAAVGSAAEQTAEPELESSVAPAHDEAANEEPSVMVQADVTAAQTDEPSNAVAQTVEHSVTQDHSAEQPHVEEQAYEQSALEVQAEELPVDSEPADEQPVPEEIVVVSEQGNEQPLFAAQPEEQTAVEIYTGDEELGEPERVDEPEGPALAAEAVFDPPFAEQTLYSPEGDLACDDANFTGIIESAPPAAADTPACPYCNSETSPGGFICVSCHAVLTMSDIEALLSNPNVNRNAVQDAIVRMETGWNQGELSADQLTVLAIGHFNLGYLDQGFKYLQRASQQDPNNVVLSSNVNTVAIRLEEINRRSEVHEAMPKGKSILVIDDSATVRKLISGKLEKSGHKVVCAADGVEGLERLAETMPDLVLLDIGMPRMDGYEVCRQIRSSEVAKHLPVVMISGKDGFFDKVRGRMAGCTGYVTKPFGPETLMKALDLYLAPEYAPSQDPSDTSETESPVANELSLNM